MSIKSSCYACVHVCMHMESATTVYLKEPSVPLGRAREPLRAMIIHSHPPPECPACPQRVHVGFASRKFVVQQPFCNQIVTVDGFVTACRHCITGSHVPVTVWREVSAMADISSSTGHSISTAALSDAGPGYSRAGAMGGKRGQPDEVSYCIGASAIADFKPPSDAWCAWHRLVRSRSDRHLVTSRTEDEPRLHRSRCRRFAPTASPQPSCPSERFRILRPGKATAHHSQQPNKRATRRRCRAPATLVKSSCQQHNLADSRAVAAARPRSARSRRGWPPERPRRDPAGAAARPRVCGFGHATGCMLATMVSIDFRACRKRSG